MKAKFLRMNDRQRRQWEKVRAKGRFDFVIYKGIIFWGLSMFVFMTLFAHLQQAGFDLARLKLSFGLVAINAAIWPVAGFLWGVLTWSLAEKQYAAGDG